MTKSPNNKNIIIASNEAPLLVDILSQFASGKYRFIVKTKLGMTCVDSRDWENERLMKYPESIISGYNNNVLQTVQYCPTGTTTWLTIFCRVGKKVKLIDETILVNTTVGTINSMYYNTNLYNHQQYKAVNSKSWASMAYQMNEEVEVEC